MQDSSHFLPESVRSLLPISQAVLGFGVGLLLGQKLGESARKTTGVTLLSVGVAAGLTWVADLVVKQINRPGSSRTMRRRLRSIREDSGIHADAEHGFSEHGC